MASGALEICFFTPFVICVAIVNVPAHEDDISSWLDCDADDAGFQPMSDGEIIVQVRKPNSDDDNSESDEDEVIETSKISNSDAFECFAKMIDVVGATD
ncbi:hypothetical protein AVEN_237880-1 [Araneus ventricosus]|uniref:Uncharacterized protein n=1 Tax=Araneus ventricosus TaxID=182803 RepID=A0A4Y2VHV4_ARAVE|nr:hypothetical protein AVEN_237880-1 [Araneus ventricosus]